MDTLERHESSDQWVAKLKTDPIVDGVLGRCRSSDSEKGNDWCNDSSSFEEACNRSIVGDPEIAKLITPRDDLSIGSSSNTSSLGYDVTGHSIDVGRYLAGDPECYVTTVKKGKPIINVVVSVCFDLSIKSESVVKRGKLVLDIVSGLETAGYSVQVSIAMSTQVGRDTLSRIVTVKSSRDFIDFNSLAFWLVSPSVHRRMNFRAKEQFPTGVQKTIGRGYGLSVNTPKEALEALGEVVYLPKINSNTDDNATILKEVLNKYQG